MKMTVGLEDIESLDGQKQNRWQAEPRVGSPAAATSACNVPKYS